MNSTELTERLIEDVKNSIKAANVARIVPQDATHLTVEKKWIELSCDITLPHRLSDLSQIINPYKSIPSYTNGQPVNLNNFLRDVELDKIKLADTFQKIQDNKNLVIIEHHLPTLFSRVEAILDEIHAEAQRIENCYQTIVKE